MGWDDVADTTLVYSPSDFVDIKLDTTDDSTISQHIRLGNEENNPPLDLMMHIAWVMWLFFSKDDIDKMVSRRLRKTSDALWINIFAPYLVLNKTGFPVAIKSRMSYRQSKHPTYNIDAFDGNTEVNDGNTMCVYMMKELKIPIIDQAIHVFFPRDG